MIERDEKGKFIKGHKGYKAQLGKKCPWAKPPHKKGKESSNYKHGKCADMAKYRKDKLKKYRKTHPLLIKEERSWIHRKENLSKKTLEKMSKSSMGRNVGEKNGNWKGGVSEENDKIRKSAKYIKWRKEVYKRDNWTCQECLKKLQSKDIVAHHKKSFSDYIELRFDIDNGITLCRSCHCDLHNKIKRAKRLGVDSGFQKLIRKIFKL